ncbi:hypothetical protein FOZ61_008408 [Perkinsus olseni]|uniref:Uncharacterized protein n=1 Tax=Perkinsus olseni TaxID=32597 RepID=A0A7J6L4T9_PEROL|nr:hypothetical protein FOZ61_008408 [Perkinsus olseni]KAF4656895.1 hypothetical protein FOL46_007638 [Perkinsus olseni]
MDNPFNPSPVVYGAIRGAAAAVASSPTEVVPSVNPPRPMPGILGHLEVVLDDIGEALQGVVFTSMDPTAEPTGEISGNNSSGAGDLLGGLFSTTELIASMGGLIVTFMLVCVMDRLAKRCRHWATAKVVAKLVPTQQPQEEEEDQHEESEVDYYVH